MIKKILVLIFVLLSLTSCNKKEIVLSTEITNSIYLDIIWENNYIYFDFYEPLKVRQKILKNGVVSNHTLHYNDNGKKKRFTLQPTENKFEWKSKLAYSKEMSSYSHYNYCLKINETEFSGRIEVGKCCFHYITEISEDHPDDVFLVVHGVLVVWDSNVDPWIIPIENLPVFFKNSSKNIVFDKICLGTRKHSF